MFQKIDLASLLASIDFSEIKTKSIESLRGTLQSIDEATKKEVHQWLNDIRKIKMDETLSQSEKESKISMVPTSDTILNFLSSLLNVLNSKFPLPKPLLKVGIAGAAMAAVARYRFGAVALLVLGAAMPKFIMSRKFDDFSDFIQRELPTPTEEPTPEV